MTDISELDIAWSAGFFDGEGSVVIWHRPCAKVNAKITYAMRVSVGCTNLAPITKLSCLFGGRIYKREGARANWKPCFMWHLSSQQAKHFLELVLPFLLVKKNQAKLGIRFQNNLEQTWGMRNGEAKTIRQTPLIVTQREDMRLEMTILNKRGQ